MHEHFPDWYREVDLNPTSEKIEQRIKGINTIVSQAKTEQVLEIVRMLFSMPLKDDDYYEIFGKAFREADATFPLRNNRREIQVLAGATVFEIISSKKGKSNNIAALATICASFLPHKLDPPIKDIIDVAEEFLKNQSINFRSNLTISSFQTKYLEIKNKLNEHAEKCKANIQSSVLAPPLIEALIETADYTTRIAQATDKVVKSISKSLDLLAEESNILWWVFGEFSRDLGVRMSNLDFPSECLVAGKELADLVKTSPGPLAANAFLDKMISSGRSGKLMDFPLKDAINMAPKDWRISWLKEKNIDIAKSICPIHLAAQISLSTDGKNDWGAIFQKSTSIKFTHKYEPLSFALQVYREGLLLREL